MIRGFAVMIMPLNPEASAWLFELRLNHADSAIFATLAPRTEPNFLEKGPLTLINSCEEVDA